MRLIELSVHAFGCLGGQILRLDDGLNVVFGRNESGKTTLKDFVETMLYGFSPANTSHPCWPWTVSARDYGGELAYRLDDGGEFRVRRHLELRGRRAREIAELREGLDGSGPAASVRAENLPQEHVRQRRGIWRNVFAIDLAALIDFADLSRSDRRSLEQVFFREMATLDEIANPRVVLAELAEGLARMKLQPGSGRRKKGEIDEFRATELAEARNELRAARDRHRRLRELQNEIAGLQRDVHTAVRQRAALNAQIEASSQRKPLVELYEQWQRAREALSEVGEVRYDEQVAARLTADLAHQEEVSRNRERSAEEVAAQRSQIGHLEGDAEADGILFEHAAAIESLARQVDEMERRRREWAAAEEAWQETRRQLDEGLAPFIRSDEPESSNAIRLSPGEADGLVADTDRWGALDNEITEAEQRLQESDEELQPLNERADDLRRRLPEDMPGEYRPSVLHEVVEVGRLLERVETEHGRVGELADRIRHEEGQLKQLRKEVADGTGRTRAAAPVTWVVAGVAALLIGAAAAAYYFWQGDLIIALWPAGLGLAGGGVFCYALVRRHEARTDEDLIEQSALLKGQLQELEQLRSRKADRDGQLAELTEQLDGAWRAAGLPETPDRKSLEEQLVRLRRFDDARADAVAYEAVVRRADELRRKRVAIKGQLESLRERRESVVRELRRRADAFDLRWDDHLAPGGARTALLGVARLASEWRSLEGERRGLDARRADFDLFDARYQTLVSVLRGVWPSEGMPADCLARWELALQAARERRRDMERLRGQLDEAERREQELREAAERLKQRIADACEQMGLDDPGDLPDVRQRARAIEQLKQRERTLADAFERQRRLADLPEEWVPEPPRDERDAAKCDSGDSYAELVARREEQEAQIGELNERVRSLEKLGQELEAGPSVAMASGALEAAYDKLASLCGRHDVLLVAYRLLDDALQEFQRERQPRIVNRAQGYLERLTAGHRRRLEADLLGQPAGGRSADEASPLQLVPESGRPRPIARFSRGAREQAYLGLRLALADELDAKESLPLILDDVLVNFDDERAASAAAMLAELGRRRQLIYLTCHEQTQAMLGDAGAKTLTLETNPAPASGPPVARTR